MIELVTGKGGNNLQGAPPTPQTNISAWVFCMRWCTDFEFRVKCEGGRFVQRSTPSSAF